MPKKSNRGKSGMGRLTSGELYAKADELEAQILDPKNEDDPKWLKRWVEKIRRLAVRKERAHENKKNQR